MDPLIYGTFGGPEMYPSVMGRENGGGWLGDPYAASDPDGKGFVRQPAEADPDGPAPPKPPEGMGTDLLRMVMREAGDPSREGGWK